MAKWVVPASLSWQRATDIILCKDRLALDGNNVCTTKFVADGAMCGVYVGGTTFGFDILEEGVVVDIVATDLKAKAGVGAGDADFAIYCVEEGTGAGVELGHSSVFRFGQKRVTVLGSLEVNDVGGNVIEGQVIHTFVKLGMFGDFDFRRFRIVPENVADGLRNVSKKDSFSGIWNKFGMAWRGRAHPDVTTKSFEVGKVGLGASC